MRKPGGLLAQVAAINQTSARVLTRIEGHMRKFLCFMGIHAWRWENQRVMSLYTNQVRRCRRSGCTSVEHRTVYPK